jgi:hypothetical protein
MEVRPLNTRTFVSDASPYAACSDLLAPLSHKSFSICFPKANSMSDFACSKLLA